MLVSCEVEREILPPSRVRSMSLRLVMMGLKALDGSRRGWPGGVVTSVIALPLFWRLVRAETLSTLEMPSLSRRMGPLPVWARLGI